MTNKNPKDDLLKWFDERDAIRRQQAEAVFALWPEEDQTAFVLANGRPTEKLDLSIWRLTYLFGEDR